MDKQEKDEPETFDDGRIECDFLDCVAGEGVAGSRHCLLHGDWRKKNCPKFQKETEVK